MACPDPPFKTSFFREHGFKKSGEMRRFFWNDAMFTNRLNNTSLTEEEMYMKMSYHLGSDWRITFMAPL